jgi:hypothetical protein
VPGWLLVGEYAVDPSDIRVERLAELADGGVLRLVDHRAERLGKDLGLFLAEDSPKLLVDGKRVHENSHGKQPSDRTTDFPGARPRTR